MKKVIILVLLISTFIVACEGQIKNKNISGKIYLVNVAQFKKGISKKSIQLVDVRTPKEYNQEKISNAVLINVLGDYFMRKINKLDKKKPIYIYCHSGGRSSKAAKKILNAGFKSIYDLDGGITAWKRLNTSF